MCLGDVLLASGVIGAVFAFLNQLGLWYIKRRTQRKDQGKQDEKQQLQALKVDLANVKQGMKAMLQERIKYLGLSYCREGAVSFEDRAALSEMHTVYHHELGGNGNLDQVMQDVAKLPLKK